MFWIPKYSFKKSFVTPQNSTLELTVRFPPNCIFFPDFKALCGFQTKFDERRRATPGTRKSWWTLNKCAANERVWPYLISYGSGTRNSGFRADSKSSIMARAKKIEEKPCSICVQSFFSRVNFGLKIRKPDFECSTHHYFLTYNVFIVGRTSASTTGAY